MDYKKKVEFAKKVASELEDQKTTDEIRSSLKEAGLFEGDISAVLLSAQNIIGEKYQSQIGEYLRDGKQIKGAQEFSSVDSEMLDRLISSESNKIGLSERKKITRLIKEGQSPKEVLNQVDTRFLSPEKAAEQIQNVNEIKNQNSSGGRMTNIGIGAGLIVLTGVIYMATGRLFYVIPFIGLGMIIKGFMTEDMAYED